MLKNVVCRVCHNELRNVFLDLGLSPKANAYVEENDLDEKVHYFPLKAYVCDKCFLVQVDEVELSNQIFNDKYDYFGSFANSWLNHAQDYVDYMIENFNLSPRRDEILEVASNDGYLLQFFKEKGYRVTGVDPSQDTANVAIKEKGINTFSDFFGTALANKIVKEEGCKSLIVCNNVLAHVPDIHDFVSGLKIVLTKTGIITVEFPHLLNLILNKQFDTIYHEHYSYLSLSVVKHVFGVHGLKIFRVQQLPIHGGSLRIFATHDDNGRYHVEESVHEIEGIENEHQLNSLEGYLSFKDAIKMIKFNTLKFFVGLKESGKRIACFGAPAKGNTFLNYCGIGKEFIDYTVDDTPYKQGKYLPGTLIPIYPVEHIRKTKPDYVFILPWNLKSEIVNKLSYIREWGGKFIIAIPEILVF